VFDLDLNIEAFQMKSIQALQQEIWLRNTGFFKYGKLSITGESNQPAWFH
jgi:hypothetical protein